MRHYSAGFSCILRSIHDTALGHFASCGVTLMGLSNFEAVKIAVIVRLEGERARNHQGTMMDMTGS